MSIYVYNEHRGYTALDDLLAAVRADGRIDAAFVAQLEQHRADEHKHYLMFKRWFERRRQMPLFVDRTCGHIDRFIEIMFGATIDHIDTTAMVRDERNFEKLCRIVALTERHIEHMRKADRRTGEVVVPLAVTFMTLAIVKNPPRWSSGGSDTLRISVPVTSLIP